MRARPAGFEPAIPGLEDVPLLMQIAFSHERLSSIPLYSSARRGQGSSLQSEGRNDRRGPESGIMNGTSHVEWRPIDCSSLWTVEGVHPAPLSPWRAICMVGAAAPLPASILVPQQIVARLVEHRRPIGVVRLIAKARLQRVPHQHWAGKWIRIPCSRSDAPVPRSNIVPFSGVHNWHELPEIQRASHWPCPCGQ